MGKRRELKKVTQYLDRVLRSTKLKLLKKALREDSDDDNEYEELYRERQEQLEEEEEKRRLREELEEEAVDEEGDLDFEEDIALWRQAAEDPEGELHLFLYENVEGYRNFFDQLVVEQEEFEVQSEAEVEDIPEEVEEAKEQTEQGIEEEQKTRLKDFNTLIQSSSSIISQFLGIEEEEAASLLQKEKDYTLEEFQREQELVNPAELLRVVSPYREFKNSGLERDRAILESLTNKDPVEADRLGRAFYSYVPPSLIRDYYNIGVQEALETNPNEKSDSFIKNADFYENSRSEIQEEHIPQFSEEDREKFDQGIEILDEKQEFLLKVIKDTKELLNTSDIDSLEFKVITKSFIERIVLFLDDFNTVRKSFPDEAKYGIQLDNLAAIIVNNATSFQEFLLNPKAATRLPSVSFLSWHNKYNLVDPSREKFNQLYALILYNVQRACARQLYNFPNLAKAPGVDAPTPQERATNLMTAVLYGLNLHHSETSNREVETLRENTFDQELELDKLLEDPILRQKTLNELPRLKRVQLETRLRQRERDKGKINIEDSVLNRIHRHLTQTAKTVPVCKKCKSSWWSFQSEAFPNASAIVFNNTILPKLAGKPKELREQLKTIKDSIFHEWRESPFKAPVGIYLGQEGQLCGGTYANADIGLIIAKLKNADTRLHTLKEEKEQQVAEYKPGHGYRRDFFTGPFKEDLLRKGIVEFDPNKIAKIVLPNTTREEVESNTQVMEKALDETISEGSLQRVDDFTYQTQEFNIAKEEFNSLREELEGHLCFHPKRQVQQSLAQLINVAVKSITQKARRILPAYAGERVVKWTCPTCQSENNIPVDMGVVTRKKETGEFQSFPVVCENPTCDQPYHLLGETKNQLASFRGVQPKSIDYRIDEDGGSIADTLEAAPTGQDAIAEIEEIAKQNQKQKEILVDKLNTYGQEQVWSVTIDPRRRTRIEFSVPNLGDIIFETLGDLDVTSLLKDDAKGALQAIDEKSLEIAHKFGLAHPFAVCLSCNTIDYGPLLKGTVAQCIHVKEIGISNKTLMNDVARSFQQIIKNNPTYPSAHRPDFEHWKGLWDAQFRVTSSKKVIHYAAIDPEDDDFSGDLPDLDEFLKPSTPEEDFFEGLIEEVEEAIEETPDPEEALSGDDFLDAAFEEDPIEEITLEEESIEEDVEETTEPPEEKVDEIEVEEDIFFNELESQTETQGLEERFEVQALENALRVLPPSEREKILGMNMKEYRSGISVDEIPQDVKDKILKKNKAQTIVAVVDDPIVQVNSLLDDVRKYFRTLITELAEESVD